MSGVVAIAIVIIAYAVGPPYADDVAGALGGITIVSAIAVYLVSLGERPWR